MQISTLIRRGKVLRLALPMGLRRPKLLWDLVRVILFGGHVAISSGKVLPFYSGWSGQSLVGQMTFSVIFEFSPEKPGRGWKYWHYSDGQEIIDPRQFTFNPKDLIRALASMLLGRRVVLREGRKAVLGISPSDEIRIHPRVSRFRLRYLGRLKILLGIPSTDLQVQEKMDIPCPLFLYSDP